MQAGTSTSDSARVQFGRAGSFHHHHHRHFRQPEHKQRDDRSDGGRSHCLYDRAVARQPQRSTKWQRSEHDYGDPRRQLQRHSGFFGHWPARRRHGDVQSGVTSVATTARTTNLTLNAAANAAPRHVKRHSHGHSGAATSSATIAITVAAPASFTLSATPASLSLMRRRERCEHHRHQLLRTASTAPWRWRSPDFRRRYRDFRSRNTRAHSGTVTFTAASSAAAATADVTITGTSGATDRQNCRRAHHHPAADVHFVGFARGSQHPAGRHWEQHSDLDSAERIHEHRDVELFPACPQELSGSFSAGATPASCILTLAVTGSAATGPSTVTITGKSGSLSETVAISLTVPPPSTRRAPSVNMARPIT